MFEKKNIELQSYLQQFKDFISRTDYTEIDIKDLLLKILDTLNEDDLKDLLNFVENRYPKLFGGLVELLNNIAIDNIFYGKYLSRDFRIKDNCKQLIHSYKRTHNIEMHMALLVGMLAKYNKSDNSFLKILHWALIPEIYEAIIHNYKSLQSKIKFGNNLSIENALCIFFFYDRDDAFKRFKILIHKDIERKKHSAYKMDYRLTIERFFKILQLDYIPKIDWVNPKILLSDSHESISRNKIELFIDSEDLFGKRTPLSALERNQILYPVNNYKEIKAIKEAFSQFFINELQISITETFNRKKINIVDVFFENISTYISDGTNREFIFVRDHIIGGFTSDILKTRFLVLLHCFMKQKYIIGATKKIATIINDYFGDKIFKKSRVHSIYNKKHDQTDDILDPIISEISLTYFQVTDNQRL